MQRGLFQHQRQRAARQRASEHHQSFDFDQGFMLAIDRRKCAANRVEKLISAVLPSDT
jgi:hypothetical protein